MEVKVKVESGKIEEVTQALRQNNFDNVKKINSQDYNIAAQIPKGKEGDVQKMLSEIVRTNKEDIHVLVIGDDHDGKIWMGHALDQLKG